MGRDRVTRARRTTSVVPVRDAKTLAQRWEYEKEREHDARTLAILALPPVTGYAWSRNK